MLTLPEDEGLVLKDPDEKLRKLPNFRRVIIGRRRMDEIRRGLIGRRMTLFRNRDGRRNIF